MATRRRKLPILQLTASRALRSTPVRFNRRAVKLKALGNSAKCAPVRNALDLRGTSELISSTESDVLKKGMSVDGLIARHMTAIGSMRAGRSWADLRPMENGKGRPQAVTAIVPYRCSTAGNADSRLAGI